MNRELDPAALLPAIQNVAGGLVVSLVIAEAARLAAEQELAEVLRQWDQPEHAPGPMATNGRHAAATAGRSAAAGPPAS